MSNTGSRGTRHFFDGTGAYIALFLVVTALAVAGYWTLIPHSTADRPVVDETPAPTPSIVTQIAVPEPDDAPDEPPMPELEPGAAPVQSAVTLTLPAAETLDLTPEPPALVVPPLLGETVAAFSMDELRYSETMGDWRTHNGVDIAAEPGTQVCAASAGTVAEINDDDLMGTTVVLSHSGGYRTVYANLQSVPTVEVGEYVTAGQVIGSVGKTALGESAEPSHLHFSVTKDGNFVDPSEFLQP